MSAGRNRSADLDLADDWHARRARRDERRRRRRNARTRDDERRSRDALEIVPAEFDVDAVLREAPAAVASSSGDVPESDA